MKGRNLVKLWFGGMGEPLSGEGVTLLRGHPVCRIGGPELEKIEEMLIAPVRMSFLVLLE